MRTIWRRPFSLRVRLSLGLAGLLLLGMIGLYIAAFAYGRTAADRLYDRLLATSARATADTLIETPGGIEVDLPYSAFELLTAASDDRVFYRVFADGDRTITGYQDLPRPPRFEASLEGSYRADARFFTEAYHGEAVRFVIIGRRVIGATAAAKQTIWVQIGQTRHAHNALARELVLRSLVPIALMTLLAMLLVWFGIAQGLKPLRAIGDELSIRKPTDLEPIRTPAPAEVDLLVMALNNFMVRLDANNTALREFVAETAHQLRTPLAALLAQAQIADRNDRQDLARVIGVVERNATKLTRLIGQMLSEATMSHRQEVGYTSRFDLIGVLHEAVHEATAFKPDCRCELDLSLDEVEVTGDPLMLAEALRNLLDNAVTHGGGDITVSLSHQPSRCILDIADRGPGVPPAQRESVFRRFIRGDSQLPGAGLGLAIAQRAVERHGGTIALLDRDGGGLVVRVILPVAA